jgi:CRISPR-associated protein Csd1
MLRDLVDFAARKGLLADLTTELRKVDFLIDLRSDGSFVNLVSHRDEKGRGQDLRVPCAPKRSGNAVAALLVDNAAFVLALPKVKKGDEVGEADIARAETYRAAFRARLEEVEPDDRSTRAVAAFLDGPAAAELRGRVAAEGWSGDEALAFRVDGDFAHESIGVRELLARPPAGDGGMVQCLVTGKLGTPARLHDSLKRVPNGQSSGTSLVSFNAAAFESQGLSQGSNAPVSQDAMAAYVRALNYLLEGTATRRFRYGVPIGPDAVTVFWTRGESEAPDLLLDLFAPANSEDDAVHAAESPLRGIPASTADSTAFFGLTLSGNAARAVVRDAFQTTAGEVIANVRRYFGDLSIEGLGEEPLALARILRALEEQPTASSDKRGLRPDLSVRMFAAALRGTPFPRDLLSAALRRLRVPPRDREAANTLAIRVAVIKAVLCRLPTHSFPEVTVSLDETNAAPPYVLGRLFAVFERLQGLALGDVNASLRDRYFAAASTRPSAVFGRLIVLSTHHVSKASKDDRTRGSAIFLERLKGEVLAKLDSQGFPQVFNLEEQGLFAIGYYHQLVSMRRKPAEPAAEATATDSNDATTTPTETT